MPVDGTFSSRHIEDILKHPDRQRRTLKDIETLAESISRLGLIHPITIDPDNYLVAGERRLEACRLLGWSAVPVQLTSDLDPLELKKIELEENVKRVDLTWQEQVSATEQLHALMKIEDPTWTAAKTAEKIGLKPSIVRDRLVVADEMKTNDRISKAKQFSVASGLTRRANERRKASDIAAVAGVATPTDAPTILNLDFNEWAQSYSGPRFNLLHCDFPYGVNLQKSDQLNATARGVYNDSKDMYWQLVKTLYANWDRLMEPSCHVVFWFSMKFYQETYNEFSHLPIKINPFPLFWLKSDGAGILPDSQRGPRQIYETALFAYGGDRKIISAVGNAITAPTSRSNKLHVSEKPMPVLSHFMRMIVDENTRILDPTCGSASALRVADALGASYCLGLERDVDMSNLAQAEFTKAKALRKASERQS